MLTTKTGRTIHSHVDEEGAFVWVNLTEAEQRLYNCPSDYLGSAGNTLNVAIANLEKALNGEENISC